MWYAGGSVESRRKMTEESSQAKAPGYRWVVFVLLAAGYLSVNFHRLCPAVVALDLMEDLRTGGALIGLLASAYFYPYALMQIPSGLLSDTWGPRKTITAFFFLAGLASILFGLAQTVSCAIVARVLVGLGVSMFFVPTMKILTRWFRVSEFAFMTGILMAVGGFGALCAATPLAYLSAFLGWRGSFVAIGIGTLVLAALIWIFVRNTPEEMGLPTVAEPVDTKPEPDKDIPLWDGVKMVLRSARFWPLALWFFLNFAIFFSFAGLWGGPYLMEVYAMNKTEAGDVLSTVYIAIIVGGPLLSYLSDRVFRSRKKILLGSSFIMLLLTVPLAFFPASMNRLILYAWSFCFGVFGSAVVVVAFATVKELFPVDIAGTAVGLVNLFPFLGSAILQPVLGVILEAQGKGPSGYAPEAYGTAFTLYFVLALISLTAASLVKETFVHVPTHLSAVPSDPPENESPD